MVCWAANSKIITFSSEVDGTTSKSFDLHRIILSIFIGGNYELIYLKKLSPFLNIFLTTKTIIYFSC